MPTSSSKTFLALRRDSKALSNSEAHTSWGKDCPWMSVIPGFRSVVNVSENGKLSKKTIAKASLLKVTKKSSLRRV
jgi:hypothetical protein